MIENHIFPIFCIMHILGFMGLCVYYGEHSPKITFWNVLFMTIPILNIILSIYYWFKN